MTNTLETICVEKRLWVAHQRTHHPLTKLQASITDCPPPRGFVRRLTKARDQHGFGTIAEIKKASPSKGLIRADFNPASLAKALQDGGASCLSVLTDTPSFQGHDNDFTAARHASTLPMLRKDFMVDPYQIWESRRLGADCVLLILAVLTDALVAEMAQLATDLGMDTLLEVHDSTELDRALTIAQDSPHHLIGINNRNLKTLKVDLSTSLDLAPRLRNRLWVAESGFQTRAEIEKLVTAGSGAFLIGESLMRQQNVTTALQELLRGETP